MTKILILTLGFTLMAIFGFAQTDNRGKTRYSIGPEVGIPIGNSGDFYNTIFGGSVKAERAVGRSLVGTFSVGYSQLSPKDEFVADGARAMGMIPLKAGLRYFVTPYLYGVAEVGVALGTRRGSQSSLVYAPGLGVSVPISEKYAIDAGARFEGWTQNGFSTEQVGLRLALKF